MVGVLSVCFTVFLWSPLLAQEHPSKLVTDPRPDIKPPFSVHSPDHPCNAHIHPPGTTPNSPRCSSPRARRAIAGDARNTATDARRGAETHVGRVGRRGGEDTQSDSTTIPVPPLFSGMPWMSTLRCGCRPNTWPSMPSRLPVLRCGPCVVSVFTSTD